MKSRIVIQLVIVTVVVLLLGFSQANAQTSDPVKPGSSPAKISDEQRETIETVVREYLLKNPSLIREANEALRLQEEKEKQARAASGLQAMKSEIYSDLDSPALGNPKGDVTVVVFFDYNCGYCKGTVPGLQDLLKKDSSVRIIYKEYPILGAQSLIAARAALAAKRQGKYAEFHQALMASKAISMDLIRATSVRLGLNYAKLRQDMDAPEVTESLQRNIRLATSLEINGTPAYIVGGRLIPGAVDATSLAQLVSDERAKLAGPNTVGVVEARQK